MNLELRQIQWSQIANQRLLAQHETAALKTGLLLEPTYIVTRLDLDDEEWEEFTTNLTEFRLWLEGQGGNGIQDEVEYRKAVKVSGPDRTIYIDPQGGAHARHVGFPQEEPCPAKSPTSPKKTSKAASTGGKATPRRTRNRKGSSARSAAKNGANSPTPVATAATDVEATAIGPAVPLEVSTVPVAAPATPPKTSSAPLKTSPVAVVEEKAADPEKVKDLFELLDDDSTDLDW